MKAALCWLTPRCHDEKEDNKEKQEEKEDEKEEVEADERPLAVAHLHFQQNAYNEMHHTPAFWYSSLSFFSIPFTLFTTPAPSLLKMLILIYADLIKMCCIQSGKTKFLVFVPIVKL